MTIRKSYCYQIYINKTNNTIIDFFNVKANF